MPVCDLGNKVFKDRSGIGDIIDLLSLYVGYCFDIKNRRLLVTSKFTDLS